MFKCMFVVFFLLCFMCLNIKHASYWFKLPWPQLICFCWVLTVVASCSRWISCEIFGNSHKSGSDRDGMLIFVSFLWKNKGAIKRKCPVQVYAQTLCERGYHVTFTALLGCCVFGFICVVFVYLSLAWYLTIAITFWISTFKSVCVSHWH